MTPPLYHRPETARPGQASPDFAKPVAAHTLTRAAEDARAAVRELGHRRRIDAIVVHHEAQAPAEPWRGEAFTTGARRLQASAERAGFEVRTDTTDHGVVVSGWHARYRAGFTACWSRGRADVGTWHEATRWELQRDERPYGLDRVARVGKAGHRSPGMGDERYVLVASRAGLHVGVSEVMRRVKAFEREAE